MQSSAISLACRKMCFIRCVYAIGLQIGTQYLLLGIFLLFVNFDILHPINWITDTFRLIMSFYTWLSIIPLVTIVAVYGFLLGKAQLSVKQYYSSRFLWFCGSFLRKTRFLSVHIAVGFSTAWVYSRFLHHDYNTLIVKCFDSNCLNGRYSFLLTAGISASVYHFARKYFRYDPQIEYPTVQEKKYVQIRSLFFSTIYTSSLHTVFPTICFSLLYWILGGFLNEKISNILSINNDEYLTSLFSILLSFRLLFYTWILASQIISNMDLMSRFSSIMLSQEMQFAITKNPVMGNADVTLVDALALDKVPGVQNLAAIDLYQLSLAATSLRRQEIFALSVPGGHPYNWNQLCGQCTSIINAFTEELATSVKNISTMKSTNLYTNFKPTATEAAEKILLRQYNETFGIRRMMAEPSTFSNKKVSVQQGACARVNDAFEQFNRQLDDAFKVAFRTIPGIFYLFGEQDGARTAFLLSNCQVIALVAEGISGICAISLVEDKYGVVQCEISTVIEALLKLKLELDKLNNVNLNGKKIDRNLKYLKNAVKRSLYKICTVFGDYMKDLIDNPDYCKQLQCFISYQET